MENKYYTPELEELFIGMEVQIKSTQTSKDWSASFNWYQENFWDLSNESIKVRVKYLDKEDIESLGWVVKKENLTDIPTFTTYIKDIYTLIQYFDNLIMIALGSEANYYKFRGFVKNKSELIKLFKQLQIK